MSETITLNPGDKVRQDGKSYKVVGQAIADVELTEVKAQSNHHRAFECSEVKCREYQVSTNGKVFTARTGAQNIASKDGLPKCQYCDSPMQWRQQATTDNLSVVETEPTV
jgi:hypothetical protein